MKLYVSFEYDDQGKGPGSVTVTNEDLSVGPGDFEYRIGPMKDIDALPAIAQMIALLRHLGHEAVGPSIVGSTADRTATENNHAKIQC